MALESFDNSSRRAFVEAVEMMYDQWDAGLSAFVAQIEAIKDDMDTEYGAERYAQLQLLRAARSGEAVHHARNIASHVRAMCYSSGVNIPYDQKGFVDSLYALSQFHTSRGAWEGGTRNARYTSRYPTRGTITPPDNVKVWALDHTEDGYRIQGGFPQTMWFEVANPPGQNQLTIAVNKNRRNNAGADWIEQLIDGAGAPTPLDLPGYDRYRTGGIPFGNPIMQSTEASDGGTIGLTELPSWTVGTADKWKHNATNTFRGLPTLKMQASGNTAGQFNLTQNIGQLKGDKPYLPVMVCEDRSTFSGAWSMHWGQYSFQKTDSDLTGAGTFDFLVPTINTGPTGKKLWPARFVSSSTPQVKFICDTLTSGDLGLAMMLLIEGMYHPGSGQWLFAAGGAANPTYKDVGSQSITFGDGSILQRVLNVCGFILEGRPG